MKVLRVGSKGEEVKKLQTLLQKNGYPMYADGVFGVQTEDKVIEFQEDNNLDADGIVGKATWDVLFKEKGDTTSNRINDTRFVLPQKNYYSEIIQKRGITLHHTNGWVVKNNKPSMNSFNWWVSGDKHVSTAFTVDYVGNIYQHFNPLAWAYHLGLKNKNNKTINQEFIGIELCNEGYLTKESEQFYWWSGKLKLKYNRPQDNPIHILEGWRGYEWYAPYSEKQTNATLWLVKYLCNTYNIEKNLINDFTYHSELLDGEYNGIYSHCNIRKDKYDISPAFNLSLIKNELFN